MKEKSRSPDTKMIARERIEILFEQAQKEFCVHIRNGATVMSISHEGLQCASGSVSIRSFAVSTVITVIHFSYQE